MSKLQLAALALGIVALVAVSKAHGHGEYDWIRKHDYRTPEGMGCCGVDDCFVPDSYYLDGDRYIVTVKGVRFWFLASDTKVSEDMKAWACVNMDYQYRDDYDDSPAVSFPKEDGSRLRCFFRAVGA